MGPTEQTADMLSVEHLHITMLRVTREMTGSTDWTPAFVQNLNHFHSLLSSVVALRHVQWPTPALSVDALQAASKVPPHRLRTTAWTFLAELSLTQTLCGYDAQTEAPPPLSSSHTLPLRSSWPLS